MDYEFILLFKKLGNAPKPTAQQKAESKLSKEEWNSYFSSHWHFSGVKQTGHIAMFPEELPKRLIKMFSFVGETVFDPFVGSGTTSLAAKKLGRNSIGYEINEDFEPIIREKLCAEQLDLLQNSQVTFVKDQGGVKYTFDNLPYIFRDPHKMDKKIDVKKLRFGSKIDSQDTEREELFTVKKVLSSDKLELNNGSIIKLIGIIPNPEYEKDAVSFLQNKFKNRKIFLKYDSVKYDSDNNLLCYVYLDNKTFINNHLARTGYVFIDTSSDYKYKKKFLEAKNNG